MTAADPQTTGIAATPAPAPRNRRGLVALILGIVALVLAFVPYASYGAWLIGIAAVVVGVLAIIRPGFRKGAGIAGIVLGAIAVVVSVIMSIVYTVLFVLAGTAGAAASGYATQSEGAPVGSGGPSHTVVYSVTSKGKAQAIAYYTVAGGQSGQTTLQGQALPWSKTVTVRGDLTKASSVLFLVAQPAGSKTIRCTITLDGKVVTTQTAKGAGSSAQCTYRPE